MTTVLQSFNTTGLCGTCYRDLPARLEYRSDGSAYLIKTCPVHGYEEAMVERDWQFKQQHMQLRDTTHPFWKGYNDVSIIEVTDRCNVQCDHCYHVPDNEIQDRDIDWVVNMARTTSTKTVMLMGAEPTLRQDLPELISRIKQIPWQDGHKSVGIYTNGVSIQNKEYMQELTHAGLDVLSMSIHHPDYHDDKIWKLVNRALQNVIASGVRLGQMSFTVETKQQLSNAVNKMLWIMDQGCGPGEFVLRSPGLLGTYPEGQQELFLSEVHAWFEEIAQEQGLTLKFDDAIGGLTNVGLRLNGQRVMMIHWPTASALETSRMIVGPWAHFVPNTQGTFIIQAVLRDGWKNGWWQGQRLVTAEPVSQKIKFVANL